MSTSDATSDPGTAGTGLPASTQDVGPTVGEYVSLLAPECWSGTCPPPTWPPDAFAVVASLLQRSGAYKKVVETWPPQSCRARDRDWEDFVSALGEEWAESWQTGEVPRKVAEWWAVLVSHRDLPLAAVSSDAELVSCLLHLCAAADEACFWAGSPLRETGEEYTTQLGSASLCRRVYQEFLDPQTPSSTLCERIARSRVKVLPKARTCQSGLTIRSLSHHLALCPSGEVDPFWWAGSTSVKEEANRSLNLLLVPWPFRILPSQFCPLDRSPTDPLLMPDRYGFFTYEPLESGQGSPVLDVVQGLYESARRMVGKIDGVILPELALRPGECAAIRDYLTRQNAFLVAGVTEPAGVFRANRVECSFPLGPGTCFRFQQAKHHRWRLDRDQIIRYGLGSRLDPNTDWWEAIPLEDRRLGFFALKTWLTMCALICEDLARPDPVADLVRSVGPNLVVALLMDGPQLLSRWPARYASVLADDPGSSVLTLTSLGMAELSRRIDDQTRSRVIALWKDSVTGAVQVALPPGSRGVVLSIISQDKEEWAADGRSDDCNASTLVLAGIHPVELP